MLTFDWIEGLMTGKKIFCCINDQLRLIAHTVSEKKYYFNKSIFIKKLINTI